MFPDPAVISPPYGSAPGSRAYKGPEMASSFAITAMLLNLDLGTPPFVFTFSETTIHFSLVLDQIMLKTRFTSEVAEFNH
jgi:hypothetical protein